VQGLGHCAACHSARNIFGATTDKLEMSGGLIPMQDWYAPSLHSRHEAGVGEWDIPEIVGLLKNGVSAQASVLGPMAEVVFHSTQYISDDDLRGIAHFLKSLHPAAEKSDKEPWYAWFTGGRKKHTLALDVQERGAKLYGEHCVECHGERGQGVLGAYPALAGNRAVTMDVPFNVIRVVLSGGYPPATAGNPRPYGMPPFSHVLDDVQIATIVTYIRAAWGNGAEPVSPVQVMQLRRGRRE
jgi:mono/diheme cytochrome c family protein